MQDKNQPKRNAKDTRERILDAALSVFSRKGYHETRLDEIVDVSGTSKGSIYFHFPNKQQLFIALVDKFADLLERRVREAVPDEGSSLERVRVALTTVLDTFGAYRMPAKILLVQAAGLGSVFESKRFEVHNRFAAMIQSYLDEGVACGDIPPLDTDIVARAWMGAINEVVISWVYTSEPEPERIVQTLLPVLLRSVGYDSEDIIA